MSLDTSGYNLNPTRPEFLIAVKGFYSGKYELIKTKDNFFIWKNGTKSEYIRLSLHRNSWNEDPLFYWDLELSFKPFNYKHNHRENAHIQSEYFKAENEEAFYNYFLNMLDRIKQYLRHR